MPLLMRKRVLAIKTETTVGTDATLAAADGAFNAYDITIQPSITVEEREGQGAFNYLPGVPGARSGTCTFRTDLVIGAAQPLWASTLLPACGVVGTSAYTPRTEALGDNVKSVTIGVYEDGKVEKLVGAVGNVRFVFPTGRMAFAEWTFTGVYVDEDDAALLDPDHPTEKPPRFASGTCTYATVAQKVEQVAFDVGNTVIMREDPTTEGGFISGLITNRYPKITANPESVLVADEDRYGDWIGCTEAAFAISVPGPSSSSVAIAAPKAAIINKQGADRSGMQVDDIEWACNANGQTEDEEFTITVTAEA